MNCPQTLPALPGGVGILSDRLAALSGRIAEYGDILAEYRQTMAVARQLNITIPRSVRNQARKALRPIEQAHTLDRLRLCILLMEQGYGKENA